MHEGRGILDKIKKREQAQGPAAPTAFLGMRTINEDRLVLLPVGKHNGHAYWGFDRTTRKRIRKFDRKGNMDGTLEVFSKDKQDIKAFPVSFNLHKPKGMQYYVPDLARGKEYQAILRLGRLNMKLRSNTIQMPNGKESNQTNDVFATKDQIKELHDSAKKLGMTDSELKTQMTVSNMLSKLKKGNKGSA